MKIYFVVAMSENGAIGYKGQLPWHLPCDLKHFKALTTNKNIIMGRKTFASIKKALPNRNNMVLTRDHSFSEQDITVYHTLDQVLNSKLEELFVIGGQDIYQLFMPYCQRIYLTLVHTVVKGDRFFTIPDNFVETNREFYARDQKHQHDFSFIELNKKA